MFLAIYGPGLWSLSMFSFLLPSSLALLWLHVVMPHHMVLMGTRNKGAQLKGVAVDNLIHGHMQKLKIDAFYWKDLQLYVFKDRQAKTKPVTGEIIYLSMKLKKN